MVTVFSYSSNSFGILDATINLRVRYYCAGCRAEEVTLPSLKHLENFLKDNNGGDGFLLLAIMLVFDNVCCMIVLMMTRAYMS